MGDGSSATQPAPEPGPFPLESFEAAVISSGHAEQSQLIPFPQRLIQYSSEITLLEVSAARSMRPVISLAERIAPTNCPVIITGETGTGKEILARALHYASPRAKGPLVAVNCAAMPETLYESELFGHMKGSFTGAFADHKGAFEQAHNGTLFLDEIGEMPLLMQSKLLRAVEHQVFRKIGATRDTEIDTRIIVATNRDLAQDVSDKKFRDDLYHRLNVFALEVLPLRERPEDIPGLADRFLHVFAKRHGREAPEITGTAMDLLVNHASWPGNIRELKNVIERAVVLCHKNLVSDEVIEEAFRIGRRPATAPSLQSPHSDPMDVIYRRGPDGNYKSPDQVKLEHMQMAVDETGGNRSRAAELLGMERHTLASAMRRNARAVDAAP